MAILERIADRILVFFAIDYGWRLGTKLASALDFMCNGHEPERIQFSLAETFDFQWPTERRSVVISSKRIAIHTLGLSPWLEHLEVHQKLLASLVDVLGLKTIKRAGFKVVAFIPYQKTLTHAEAADLMFGSFLGNRKELAVFGDNLDPLFHIQGKKNDYSFALQLTPVSAEQANDHALANGQFDKFVSNRYTDAAAREFLQRVTQDASLLFDVDLSRLEFNPSAIRQFITGAVKQADEFAEQATNFLHSRTS